MIGFVLVTHGNLGIELIKTAEIICGETLSIKSVSINGFDDATSLRMSLKDIILSVDNGHGVLVLTDIFGGTPSNICISLMEDLNIEVVSGVNIPMMIKIPYLQKNEPLKNAVFLIKECGKKNISAANEILKK